MPKGIVLKIEIGDKVGKFEVVSRAESKYGHRRVVVRCECGEEREIAVTDLKSRKMGGCHSCVAKARNRRTHELSKHPLYKVWHQMVSRCTSQDNQAFHAYGGRGITVCTEWTSDFKSFFSWGMKNGWEKGLQLERVDNNAGYSPENCKFATRSEQCRNTRRNRMLTHDGQTRCLREWSEKTGLTEHCIESRLKRGWSVSDSLTVPLKKNRNALQMRRE